MLMCCDRDIHLNILLANRIEDNGRSFATTFLFTQQLLMLASVKLTIEIYMYEHQMPKVLETSIL